MRLDHIALYTGDLERLRLFYQTYFGAESNQMYHNPRTGLQTYFLSFEGGARLEIMARPGVETAETPEFPVGLTHLAFSVPGREAVDALTRRLTEDGFALLSPPRVTGDGYYESCVADPDGNRVEIVG